MLDRQQASQCPLTLHKRSFDHRANLSQSTNSGSFANETFLVFGFANINVEKLKKGNGKPLQKIHFPRRKELIGYYVKTMSQSMSIQGTDIYTQPC